jgi:FMN phosphatase YigB (HAD superfamily)
MNIRQFSLVIFDLDNTLYDWYAAFLPAFYDMVSVASLALKCEQDDLLDQLRRVHVYHGDVEHPFSLLETDVVKRLAQVEGEDRISSLLDPAFHAFNRSRKANLKLYPGTIDVLKTLRGYGIQLVAYTDSKYYAAWGRVERLGLVDLFEKVYCREKDASNPKMRTALSAPFPGKVVEIPSHESKPNPRVLMDIVAQQHRPMSEVAYIGDSLAKDVLMGKRANCFTIWAKYGAHTNRAMYDRLVRISHWTAEDIERERNYASEAHLIKPDFICEHSLWDLIGRADVPDQTSPPTAATYPV